MGYQITGKTMATSIDRSNVEIVVKDMKFFKYIETCIQFLGSGTYMVDGNKIKLNASLLHKYLPQDYITNVLKREHHNPDNIVAFNYK